MGAKAAERMETDGNGVEVHGLGEGQIGTPTPVCPAPAPMHEDPFENAVTSSMKMRPSVELHKDIAKRQGTS